MDTKATSIETLRKITKAKAITKKQQKVFDELLKHGDKGLTSNEVEARTGDRRASSRLRELKLVGWVLETPRLRRNDGENGPGTGGTANILIIPKHVRKGGDPIPPPPTPSKPAIQISIGRTKSGQYAVYIEGKFLAGAKGKAEQIDTWPVNTGKLIKAIEAKTE